MSEKRDAPDAIDGRASLTEADFAATCRSLKAIVDDRSVLAAFSQEQRKTLMKLAGQMAHPDPLDKRKLSRKLRRQDRQQRRDADEAQRQVTGIRQLRAKPVFVTPGPELMGSPIGRATPTSGDTTAEPPRLIAPRLCYACKAEFVQMHSFYDQMCQTCGDLNYQKRVPKADLSGRVALLTGGRVKIGFHAGILLLRNGCHLIVTTRFPKDAAARYAQEPDFDQWAHRLDIYGLDLRHTPSVECVAKHLSEHYERLDFIIHNACQTVRRPPAFYSHLLDAEQQPFAALPEVQRQVLNGFQELGASELGRNLLDAPPLTQLTPEDVSLTQSALPSSRHEEKARNLQGLFPQGVLDADLQQVDLRDQNSWRLRHHEVPTMELLEVFLVNAVGPFVLSARLKPLMLRTDNRDKHIVNVSAMEGQFHRNKTDKHPHTNMAKAALNMLTRTAAQDYVKDGIHMNSVDTGWITDEDPAHLTQKKIEMHNFSPPLDVVDGAARIVDPIFVGMQSGNHPWGQFFKDYLPTHW